MEDLVDLIVYIYNDYGMLTTVLFLILVLSVLGLFWRCFLKNGSTNRITAEHKSKIIFINGDNNNVRK